MNKINYLAYGSNIHPLRLQKRVPSARLIGVAPLAGKKLEFSKRSKDGSGKCTIANSENGVVFTALFSIDRKELQDLDRVEGVGYGYEREKLKLRVEGKTIDAFTYIASASHIDSKIQPYHWYKNFVVEGARYLSFPGEYLDFLHGFESVQDQDDKRRAENEALLVEMKTLGVDFPYEGNSQ